MALTSFDIIKNVRITEKGTIQADKFNKFTLRVDPRANAIEIKKAVEALFHVKVEAVRVLNVQGKLKRQGRFVGRRPDWKKAYVVLKQGEKMIEFFEQA